MATRKLTMKQKGFVKHYVDNRGNGAQAVRDAGYNIGGKGGGKDRKSADNVARTIATENIIKPAIVEALFKREVSMQEAYEELARDGLGVQVSIMNDQKTKNSLKNQIGSEFQDRAGYKPTERTESTLKMDLKSLSYQELVDLHKKAKEKAKVSQDEKDK